MFFDEVARKCYEVASQDEKEAETPVPVPRRPTTLPVKPQNALQSVDNQGEFPQTSATMSGSTYTMTVSSNPGEMTTTTTTAKTADGSSPLPENFNTSGKTMRRRIEPWPTEPGNNTILCSFANLFAATTGTNTRNATFKSVHSALLP